MTATTAAVHLEPELESRPERVMLVRSMLAAVSESLALDARLADDIRTAVSEACNNVVQHAYCDRTGPMLVTLNADGGRVAVGVSDSGHSLCKLKSADGHMGVGLAVIAALADRTEIKGHTGVGTDVRMSFGDPASDHRGGNPWERLSGVALIGDVVAVVCPVGLLGPLLRRATGALAESHFSIDRFDDLCALTDTITASTEHAATVPVTFAIKASVRRLELTVGPFPSGSRPDLRAQLGGKRRGLLRERYAMKTEVGNGQELLHVLVLDRTPAPF